MTRASVTVVSVALLGVGLTVSTGLAAREQAPARSPQSATPTTAAPRPAPSVRRAELQLRRDSVKTAPVASHAPSPALSAREQSDLVKTYCATCHSERAKAGGLSLAGFDAMKAHEQQDVVEKMIRKLSAGLMPPPGAKRPDAPVLASLTSALEGRMDEYAAANPNPGRRTFQRLNRPEYERAIADLLALDVDAANWLPLDQKSANFDNIADEQGLSPTLLEAYLNAAGDISRMAVGDKQAPRVDSTYTNPSYVSQHPWDHVEGAPYGTRGGMVVNHVFPADAEYEFELLVISGDNARGEDIDVSIDGQRVALVKFENAPAAAADGRGGFPFRTDPVLVRAGEHKIAVAFVKRTDGPYEDLIKPHEWSYAGGGSGGAGITTLPHLRDLVVAGPYNATGVSETPSRQRIFSCRPTASSEERPCARSIVTRLAGEAYRRPLTTAEADSLMPFYEKGAAAGGFEAGVRSALEAVLASPHFVFRMERERPATAAQGSTRVADLDMASRLSFFLWGAPPDQELVALATSGKLQGAVLEKQAQRLLADPRADGARPPLRGAVAAAPGPRQGPPRSELLPELRREHRRSDEGRDRDLLQRPGASRRQPARPLHRRLHLRERAAGPALRLPRRRRQPLPQGHLSRPDTPRHPRPGLDAGADVAGQPHLAGAARQVGDGGAARHAAAAAAAQHPGARGSRRGQGRQAPDHPRADGTASRQPDVQRLPPVHGSDRPRRSTAST